MNQKQLRDAIKAVQGDESLDATTKAKRIRVRGFDGCFSFK